MMMYCGLFLIILLNQCVAGDASVQAVDGPCKIELKSISSKPLMIGATKPQCDEQTGNYLARQCSGSVGSCLCVDKTTGKSVGESLTTGENGLPDCEPNCFVELRKELQKDPFLVGGVPDLLLVLYIPRCDMKNGYFEPKQCMRDKKECWCVSKLGKELENTRSINSDLKCET